MQPPLFCGEQRRIFYFRSGRIDNLPRRYVNAASRTRAAPLPLSPRWWRRMGGGGKIERRKGRESFVGRRSFGKMHRAESADALLAAVPHTRPLSSSQVVLLATTPSAHPGGGGHSLGETIEETFSRGDTRGILSQSRSLARKRDLLPLERKEEVSSNSSGYRNCINLDKSTR